MKKVVFESMTQTARISYANAWFATEFWIGCEWVKIGSYRNIETAVYVIASVEAA
jgi:hypothetical protein